MSRYPQPGSVVWAFWEGSDYESVHAGAVVMATSRHKRSLTDDEALALLKAEHGERTTIDRIGLWRTITQADYDAANCPMESEVGGWAEECSGQAWVKVAYPTLGEDPDDDPRGHHHGDGNCDPADVDCMAARSDRREGDA